jgi:hypothetical protein
MEEARRATRTAPDPGAVSHAAPGGCSAGIYLERPIGKKSLS